VNPPKKFVRQSASQFEREYARMAQKRERVRAAQAKVQRKAAATRVLDTIDRL